MSEAKNPMGDTDEFVIPQDVPSPSAGAGRVRVDCAGLSHPGLVREHNEDHFLVARFGRYLTPLQSNIPGQAATLFEEEGHGLVVADGMGGAAAGEMASKLAIRTLMELVVQTPDWIISPKSADAERVMDRMADRFARIDDRILAEAAKNPRLRGMGTTMTLACNVGDSLVLTHIGDSRAYLFRAGALHQLTHDHTLAQTLVDQGFLKQTADAARHIKHSLIRVLGGSGQQCEADVERYILLDQDQDSPVQRRPYRHGEGRSTSRANSLAKGATANEASEALVECALKNGGKDNVTVVVARYAFINRAEAS